MKEEIKIHLNFTELIPKRIIKLIVRIKVEHIKTEKGKKTQEVNIVWKFNKLK